MSSDRVSTIAPLLSALLAGASGLALESLLVSSSGLALGYGGSIAIGLALWLAAWALGAWIAGRVAGAPARTLVSVGGSLVVVSPLSAVVVLWTGDACAGRWFAPVLAGIAITAPALLQGAFLPLLARGSRSLATLFAWNLVGSLCGAYVLADLSVGAFGRLPAAWIAGGCALLAGSIGARAKSSDGPIPGAGPDGAASCDRWQAACVIGLGVAWMSALEWVLVRLGVLWLGGMQNALNAVLCASLLALALGAAVLPACLPRDRRGVLILLCLCVLASLWPFGAAPALRAVEAAPVFVRALVLCAPALLPFGGVVPITASASERSSRGALGALLLHESWGALLGIPLIHFLIVPWFGLPGAIATGLAFGTIALLVLLRRSSVGWFACPLFALSACLLATRLPTPALASPPLSNPAFTVRDCHEDRDFTVAVVDDGLIGERTLLTDGFRAAGTGRDYLYMEALGHLPLLLHPAPQRVAVLALGTGTTLGAVALHAEVERIDVLEISRAVVAAAPEFLEKNHGVLSAGLPALLDDSAGAARVVVRLGDGRATLARNRGAYDVVTMEPLLPDSPFAVYLYTREFYGLARRALRPGGLVCQWVPPHALEPVTFDAVLDAFAASFPWTGAWLVGTQVLLVGGDREPELDPARFEPTSPALAGALAALGLRTPADVVARWCGPLAASRSGRALTDADPWIVYRPRRQGAALLTDLGRNLAAIRALEREPPAGWLARSGAGVAAKIEGLRALRAARAAHAWLEAEMRGVRAPDTTSFEFDASLARARSLLPDDPEWMRFDDEIEFLDALRIGVSHLTSSPDRAAAEQAIEPLIRAAKARPERADVHLYCAVALERLGSPKLAAVLEFVRTLCPTITRTTVGARARSLGLSDAAWAALGPPERGRAR